MNTVTLLAAVALFSAGDPERLSDPRGTDPHELLASLEPVQTKKTVGTSDFSVLLNVGLGTYLSDLGFKTSNTPSAGGYDWDFGIVGSLPLTTELEFRLWDTYAFHFGTEWSFTTFGEGRDADLNVVKFLFSSNLWNKRTRRLSVIAGIVRAKLDSNHKILGAPFPGSFDTTWGPHVSVRYSKMFGTSRSLGETPVRTEWFVEAGLRYLNFDFKAGPDAVSFNRDTGGLGLYLAIGVTGDLIGIFNDVATWLLGQD